MSTRIKRRTNSFLQKRARRGFRGYPVATVAFYGPDDQRASKVAVAIMPGEDAEPLALERWFSDDRDIRGDLTVAHNPSESSEILSNQWLGGRDSNPDTQIQSLQSYH